MGKEEGDGVTEDEDGDGDLDLEVNMYLIINRMARIWADLVKVGKVVLSVQTSLFQGKKGRWRIESDRIWLWELA